MRDTPESRYMDRLLAENAELRRDLLAWADASANYSVANVELRVENQALQDRVAQLQAANHDLRDQVWVWKGEAEKLQKRIRP